MIDNNSNWTGDSYGELPRHQKDGLNQVLPSPPTPPQICATMSCVLTVCCVLAGDSCSVQVHEGQLGAQVHQARREGVYRVCAVCDGVCTECVLWQVFVQPIRDTVLLAFIGRQHKDVALLEGCR